MNRPMMLLDQMQEEFVAKYPDGHPLLREVLAKPPADLPTEVYAVLDRAAEFPDAATFAKAVSHEHNKHPSSGGLKCLRAAFIRVKWEAR